MIGLYLTDKNSPRAIIFRNTISNFSTDYKILFAEDYKEANHIINSRKISYIVIDTEKISDSKELNKAIRFCDTVKKNNENIAILAITENKEHCYEAAKIKADEIFIEPITVKNITKFILNYNNSHLPHKIFFRTIPNFTLLIDGKVVQITSPKMREMLAFLVDKRGIEVTNNNIISALWSDQIINEHLKNSCRLVFHHLKEFLKKHDIRYILNDKGTTRYLNTAFFNSDLQELLSGNEKYILHYNGEYLKDYEWAENTNAEITQYLINTNQYNLYEPNYEKQNQ